MSFTFKDKLELRQLQSKMHSSTFGVQNDKIAKSLKIDPRWMFQSRLNYRYIYKEKDSFWPDWAKEQYLETNNKTYYPINDLYCLNLLDKQFFSFINSDNNFRVDVNKTGYISFPFLNFGILLKSYDGDSFNNFFKDDIALSNSGPTINYSKTTNNLCSMFSFDFDSTSSIIKLSVSFKNLTDKAITNSFSLGVLPYTNEGVGSIKTINYLSNQRFVINDRFFMQCCSQPSNVICTTFEQGNIFDRSLEWEMIFDAKCSDFLASGLINYTNKIQKNDTTSYEFYFSYSNHQLIPLLSPFNQIQKNKLIHTNFESLFNTESFMSESRFSYKGGVDIFDKTSVITNNFTFSNVESFSKNFIDLFFQLIITFQVNDQNKKEQLLTLPPNKLFSSKPLSFLLTQQSNLLFGILTVSLFSKYRFIDNKERLPYVRFIHKNISNDYFLSFIKKLSLQRFQKLISSPYKYQIIIKLIIYNFIFSELNSNEIQSTKGNEYQQICDSYLQFISNDDDTLNEFIEYFSTTSEILVEEKLFLCIYILPSILSTQMLNQIIQKIENHAFNSHQLIDEKNNKEKNMLLFSAIAPPSISLKILEKYVQNINSLGHYHNASSRSIGLTEFPYSIKSYNQLYLHGFFRLIFHETKSSLTITAPQNFSSLIFERLYTRFGSISLEITKLSDNETSVRIDHSFNYSPKNIYIVCDDSVNYYSFSKSKNKQQPIKSNKFKLPINQSHLYLLS